MTPEEWQTKLDSDFKNGAVCRRMSAVPAFSFRTTCLTVSGQDKSGNPNLTFFNYDVEGYVYHFPIAFYEIIQTDPIRLVLVVATDGTEWRFTDAISDEVAKSWTVQRTHDREIAAGRGV